MNGCPACYQPQEYYYSVYYPTGYYQPMFWQAVFTGLMGLMILVAMAGVAISTLRRGIRGEEVRMPFIPG